MACPTKKSRVAKEQQAKHPTKFTTVLQHPHSIDGPDNHDPDWEESPSDENEDFEPESARAALRWFRKFKEPEVKTNNKVLKSFVEVGDGSWLRGMHTGNSRTTEWRNF